MATRNRAAPPPNAWVQLRTFCTISLVGLLVFLGIRIVTGKFSPRGPVFVALLPTLIAAVLAWKQQFYRIAGHLLVLGAFIAVGLSHTIDGLIHSPSLWVVGVVPVTAGLLLGPISMLIHTLIAGAIITLAWQGPSLGLPYPDQIKVGYLDWALLRVIATVVVSMVGLRIVRDTESAITEIARQRVLLQSSHRAAREFDAEKSRFLTQMVHEIRTPMNGIKGIVQHWTRQKIDPELRESVNVMNRCADRLMAMMSDIQDLSTIDEGSVETLKQAFLVNAAVNDVALIFEAKAASKGLNLEVSGPEEDHWAIGDGQRLVQVLSNLVANAIKFSDQGTVCLTWIIDGQGHARFTVSDQGIGMTPEQVEHLFQKYAQVDLDEGVSRGGTGLGLTTSKALSEAMDGDLSVESVQGEWTKFHLRLPLPVTKAPSVGRARTAEADEQGADLVVLIVDDDPVSLLVQRLALKQMGCVVHCCTSGQEGHELASKQALDLILMDLRMPGLDGIQTTQKIRESSGINTDTPVIALTASSDLEDRRRCIDCGMQDVLVKPFVFETLERCIQASRITKEAKKRVA